jgi:hypothetical protein
MPLDQPVQFDIFLANIEQKLVHVAEMRAAR